ncbi:hypothetical protein FA13DRAFT_1789826 [Coprinellus micaceus]|uniref:Conidiation protein 6 n=1 Tax=Coprinellus micaceus TaxID=71717 RepID=A0A4Y7THC5_COPMI|nr:hypothetical protein FA13DRAFT_1789826 [Coprinellus micaceus]
MSSSHTKDPGRVISGLKASIHNPNVSEEAKDRARHRLADLGDTSDASKEDRPVVEEFKLVEEVEQNVAEGEGGEKNVHQLGGFKATMHNPRTSKAAKDHAKQVLEQNDAL